MPAGYSEYQKGKDLKEKEQYKEAFVCFSKAAELGNIEACNEVGECYFYGNGVAQDNEKAFSWYRKAAIQGHSTAQVNLGYCYSNGVGVEQDYSKSFEWYQKAADQGNPDGLLNLGNRYNHGQGVKADPQKAYSLYISAAEKGNAMGYFLAGVMLYYEDEGIGQDYAKAYKLFNQCAEKTNHRQARYYLGEMSLLGKGVSKNIQAARVHLSLSAFQGYKDAIELIEKHSSELFDEKLTSGFYNWLMAQTVRHEDMKQSPDYQMFMLVHVCMERGLDYYAIMGVVSSRLSEIAFQSINREQAIMINYFELAKKWMSMVAK